MRSIETSRFGSVRFHDEEIIEFPAGLPGFEEEHQFLLIETSESQPFKFLQSVATPVLSFVCAPLELVAGRYDFDLPRGDRETLALPAMDAYTSSPLDSRLEWLSILCFSQPEAPTANLLGPIVLRRDIGLGVQSIREDAKYSARQPLFSPSQLDGSQLEGARC